MQTNSSRKSTTQTIPQSIASRYHQAFASSLYGSTELVIKPLASSRSATKSQRCNYTVIQRLIENGEMPKPIQVSESNSGRLKRLWDSKQLEPLRAKVDLRKKYIPLSNR